MDYQTIPLQRDATTPLYRQLAEFIHHAIADEKIESHVGRGTFVRARQPTAVADLDIPTAPAALQERQASTLWMQSVRPQLPSASRREWDLIGEHLYHLAHQADHPIDFADAVPDPLLFPLGRWQQSMKMGARSLAQDAAADMPSARLQYGGALGDPALRSFLAQMMERYGFHPDPDEILLTSGTQQSLDLIARTFVAPGDQIIVEEMTYLAALAIFERQRPVWHPVPVDDEGMRVEDLAQHLSGPQTTPRVLYTIPVGQSPTGVCLSEQRRGDLVRFAEHANVVIVEDLVFNDLYLTAHPPPFALQHYSTEQRVISLISFNKTIFPAVRMGCIIAARPLIEILAHAKQEVDRTASVPLARALLRHIEVPEYGRELEHFRHQYREKRDRFVALLEQWLRPKGCHWMIPQAGFSLMVHLPTTIDAFIVAKTAAQQGVFVLPGQCFAPIPGLLQRNAIRLGYGNLSFDTLEEGIRRLDYAIEDVERHPTESHTQGHDHLPHA